MKMSLHATQRCQSRGIPADCGEILLRHGTPIPRPGGAMAFYLSKKALKAAMEDCRKLIKTLERASNAAIIVGDDGTCVTAYKAAMSVRAREGR